MRVLLAALGLLLLPVSANAGPARAAAILQHHGFNIPADLPAPAKRQSSISLEPYQPLKPDARPVTTQDFGPIQAESGGAGPQSHMMRYHFRSVDVLGGSMTGTVDGGPKLMLQWNTN